MGIKCGRRYFSLSIFVGAVGFKYLVGMRDVGEGGLWVLVEGRKGRRGKLSTKAGASRG